MKVNEKIKTKYATIWMDSDNIVHIVFFPTKRFTTANAREYILETEKYAEKVARPVLIDWRNVESADNDIGKHLLGEVAIKYTKASAVLTKPLSPILEVGMLIYSKLHKEPFPVRFFIREEEALDWLKEFK